MGKINTTANMGWLKSVQQTAAETPAASHCSGFVGVKAEESFWDHEVTLARPAAAGIIMKGVVQPHTCICFSAMTQICRPHSVVSFNHPGNSSLHMLCRRFSMQPFREIFICIFFPENCTSQELLCTPFTLYSYSSQGSFVKMRIFSTC